MTINIDMEFERGLTNWYHAENQSEKALKAIETLRYSYLHPSETSLSIRLGLRSLPEQLSYLTHLETLDLSDNKFTVMPPSIKALTHLTDLSLIANELTGLPSDISRLIHLERINLAGNKLTALPTELCSLTRLDFLGLEDNQLTSLPPEFTALQNLKRLYLDDNDLTSILPICSLTKLEQLTLSGNRNLCALPREFSNLTMLNTLLLESTNLSDMMPITNLVRIKVLSLSLNPLMEIPPEISFLRELRELDLKGVQISFLPFEIGYLNQLRKLDLGSNNLRSLPPTMGALDNLACLYLDENPLLRELPLRFESLVNLLTLSIDRTLIPQSVANAILRNSADRRWNKKNRFSNLLNLWALYARTHSGRTYDLSHIYTYDIEQLKTIASRLQHLTTATYFERYQCALADIVCEMLQYFKFNDEWRDYFIGQSNANTRGCSDRAEAALNEAFVQFKLSSMDPNAPLIEKLHLLKRCVKAIVLFNRVGELISAYTRTTGHEYRESAETVLYYTLKLKEKHDIISAVDGTVEEGMAYPDIGKRSWIDEEALSEYIENCYLTVMAEMEITQTLASKDETFARVWEMKQVDIATRQEDLEAKQQDMQGMDYINACNALLAERKATYIEMVINWIQASSAIESTSDEEHSTKRKKDE